MTACRLRPRCGPTSATAWAARRSLTSSASCSPKGVTVRGGIDGYFSIWTVYAVQTFQRMHGIHANGIVDETTARALGMLSGSWTAFGVGATGTSVTRVQQALINRGIAVRGGATGRFDVWTMYAVQTFQRRQGLRISGVVDGQTARALGLLTAPHPSSVWTALSQGSTGINVARAQRALMDRGVFVRGGATGRFDVYTYYAVLTFQRHNGLRVTGVVDVETAKALGLFDLANPLATWVDLALGSAGAMVQSAEQALLRKGVYVRDGVDGVFKLWDFYAVNTFQRYNGLPVTGRIDLATASRLGMFEPVTTIAATSLAVASAAPLAATITSTMSATTPMTTTSTPTTTLPITTTPTTTISPTTTTTAPPIATTVTAEVWIDLDANGIADPSEPRLPAVVVRLLDASGVVVDQRTSDDHGLVVFPAGPNATYRLEAEVPVGYAVTLADEIAPGLDADTSDDVDSDFVETDVVAALARTDPLLVGSAGVDDIALGLVPVPGSTTTTTSLPPTSTAVTTEPSTTQPSTSAPATSEPTTTSTVPATTSTVPATTEPQPTDPATTASTSTTIVEHTTTSSSTAPDAPTTG